MTNLYTIGYATKPINEFLSQLKRYHVDVVADVRSVPYSKVFTDYHKENIMAYLRQNNIRYVYLGDELGPRSKDNSHYDETGQVQFELLMQSELFKSGITRLSNGLDKGFNIALMCAEKDAATCHRSLLIGYYLQREGLGCNTNDKTDMAILHIDHHGEIEQQAHLEKRISEMNDVPVDLFRSEEDSDYEAYKVQLKKTSYVKPF